MRLLKKVIIAASIVAVSLVNGRAQDSKIDWPRYQDMAVELMQQYLRINTSNPPFARVCVSFTKS